MALAYIAADRSLGLAPLAFNASAVSVLFGRPKARWLDHGRHPPQPKVPQLSRLTYMWPHGGTGDTRVRLFAWLTGPQEACLATCEVTAGQLDWPHTWRVLRCFSSEPPPRSQASPLLVADSVRGRLLWYSAWDAMVLALQVDRRPLLTPVLRHSPKRGLQVVDMQYDASIRCERLWNKVHGTCLFLYISVPSSFSTIATM